MHIPHTIPNNTYVVYKPSEQTQLLPGEIKRTLKSEDTEWDKNIPPTLITLCVQSLVSNFQDGIYWKRSSEDRWESEYIEKLELEQYNTQEIADLLNLCSPYIRRLNIRQLQAAKLPESVEWQSDEDDTPEEPSLEHINLEPFIKGLENLEELHIMFGVRDCGMDFAWSLFKFSIIDCRNIGLGIVSANCIKVFRIHRSTLDDLRVANLMQYIVKNTTITRLDFSHCRIADSGAKGVGGLAYALSQRTCCPLQLLDLRLNVIGDEGVIDLCSALVTSKYPQELNLAGCGFTETAAIKLGQMLQQNYTLLSLDVSNNNLGEVAGEAFHLGLTPNTTLLKLDFRMTGITEEYEILINTALKSNIDKLKLAQRELVGNS
ncbi:T-complex-associated testis-expressed protein 1 [Blattella germanica]|nr:T-complex-associated testis-expressed protein 1 [Blattella germanica]